jgi:hypothetical protein
MKHYFAVQRSLICCQVPSARMPEMPALSWVKNCCVWPSHADSERQLREHGLGQCHLARIKAVGDADAHVEAQSCRFCFAIHKMRKIGGTKGVAGSPWKARCASEPLRFGCRPSISTPSTRANKRCRIVHWPSFTIGGIRSARRLSGDKLPSARRCVAGEGDTASSLPQPNKAGPTAILAS